MADQKEIDPVSGVETTGHSWDGIKELNTPLPRWWLWTFYLTIVFSIIYVILYPAIPLINGATQGVLGWSSRADLHTTMDEVRAANADQLAAIESSDMPSIIENAELRTFAIAAGQSAFKVYCVQCHGEGAAGAPGYPNLNDDAWLWGGAPETIYTTILHGVRDASDDDTRYSEMPAFGRDELLTGSEISDVAWYVRKLSGQQAEEEAAARGETLFVDNCAVCHGDDGGGLRDFGAPNLSDAIWLYGGSHDQIMAQVREPRHGVMPSWGAKLGETTVKQLATYVHSLGGGE